MNRTSYPYSHLFRGNRLYTNTEYFDAKAEEATLTKRYNKTYKSTTKDMQKLRLFYIHVIWFINIRFFCFVLVF